MARQRPTLPSCLPRPLFSVIIEWPAIILLCALRQCRDREMERHHCCAAVAADHYGPSIYAGLTLLPMDAQCVSLGITI